MAHYAVVWELGLGVSYAKHIALITKILTDNDHKVSIIARDIIKVQAYLKEIAVPIYQAPIFQAEEVSENTNSDLNGSYAGILVANQYHRPQVLSTLIQAWQQLLSLLQPDVLICEHAPTAILANQHTRLVIQIGSGYLTPPETTTEFSVLLSDNNQSTEQSKLLESINQGLTACGLTALEKLGDIFKGTQQYITSLACFDPRPDSDRQYIGLLDGHQLAPRKRHDDENKICVYLPNYHPCLANLLSALSQYKAQAVVRIAGATADKNERLTHLGFQLYEEEQFLQQVESARIVIHYGGLSACHQIMASGASQLIIPLHDEQRFNAEILVQHQSTLCVKAGAETETFSKAIRLLLSDGRYHQAAFIAAEQVAAASSDAKKQLTEALLSCI